MAKEKYTMNRNDSSHGSEIIGDRQPPRSIRNDESSEQYLRNKLLILHQVGNELSLAGSLDELCRLAVVRGRQLLGYQRIGLWFRVAHSMVVTGSFGVDEQGQIRDERGKSLNVSAHSPMGQVLNHRKSLLIDMDCPLRNNTGEVVGRGIHVIAALWDGAKVVGCICMDNLLEPHRSLQANEGEILKLYASTVGHLVNRKRVEEELQKAKDVADAANRAKSFFLANMSHEIRTPMNAIMGFTDLVLRSGLTAEQRQYLEIVQARSKDLLVLISDILDLSMIEADRLELKPVQFSIAQTLNDIVGMFSLDTAKKGLRLSMDISREFPEVIYGDQQRLRQVLVNLVGNAVKFTEQGEIIIKVERDGSYPGSDDCFPLHFRVQDNGIGIPADRQKVIFESFIRDNNLIPKYGGTGLGLAIAKRLVEIMGGNIWCESKVGKGSTFHFTVRFLRQRVAGTFQDNAIRAAAPVRRRQLRVLIVEDDAGSQLLAQLLLEELGHQMATATTGKEALRKLSENDFDLVLMDVHIPEMDGLEITKQIRNQASPVRNHAVPIIAMTASAMKIDEEACIQAGMNNYISKPMLPHELVAAIDKVIP
ncbi:MAG: ATP-binding protein [Thermoplasmata archaeon]|nr:ATP-binding protein [Thermoplasmata archaeon]